MRLVNPAKPVRVGVGAGVAVRCTAVGLAPPVPPAIVGRGVAVGVGIGDGVISGETWANLPFASVTSSTGKRDAFR